MGTGASLCSTVDIEAQDIKHRPDALHVFPDHEDAFGLGEAYGADHTQKENADEPLLRQSERDTIDREEASFARFSRAFHLFDKTALAASGLLLYQHHPILRSAALAISLLLMFILGAGLTSFPIWLNEGIATHVLISSSGLSILGSAVFGSMGAFCLLLLVVRRFSPRRHVQFTVLSLLGALALLAGWGLAIWLIHTGADTEGGLFNVFKHNVYNVLLALSLVGSGTAVFYVVWLGELAPLLKPEYISAYWATANALLALGATFALFGKLRMSSWHMIVWRGLATFATLAVALGLVLPSQLLILTPATVVTARESLYPQEVERRHNNLHPEEGTPRAVADYSFALLGDLVCCRRDYSRLQCRMDQYCDVSSRQFYFICLAYALLAAVGGAFLAFFGVMAQQRGAVGDDPSASVTGTDIKGRETVKMALFLSFGDLLGRAVVPVVRTWVEMRTPEVEFSAVQPHGIGMDANETDTSTDARMRSRTRMSLGVTRRHVGMARTAHVQNNAVLSMLILAGVVFVFGAICLRFFALSVTFVQASSLMGLGHGLVWSAMASFPVFFPNSDFTSMFALLIVLCAGATVVFVALGSSYCSDNGQLFGGMLGVAMAGLICAVCAFVDRRATEVQVTQSNREGYRGLGLERERPRPHHSRSGKMAPQGSRAAMQSGSHPGGAHGGSHQGRHFYSTGEHPSESGSGSWL